MTVLKIIAIIGLVGILVLVGVAFFVMRFLKGVAKQVKEAVGMLPSLQGLMSFPPCRINPRPQSNPQWRNASQVQKYADDLKALGFEDAGAYRIPELSNMLLLGLVHPNERLMAAIYDHEKMPPTFDIVADFEDGTSVAASNTTMGETNDKRPGHEKFWLGDVSAQEILSAVQNHPSASARKLVTRAEYRGYFKKSYADGMNWRMKKGGVSREEIKRRALKDKPDMTDEQLEECYDTMRTGYLMELQSGCIAQFLDDQRTPASDWVRVRDRAFAIPETMTAKEVSEAFMMSAELDEDEIGEIELLGIGPGETAQNLVDKVLANGIKNVSKLGEVNEPVRAYILVGPERADDEDEDDVEEGE